ncbi:MAG: terminase [Candidatus Saccharibacteria bacterium]|nr:terminase [Candidatus Saccharibacteria bacterium]
MAIEFDQDIKARFLEVLSETANVTEARKAVGLTARRLFLLKESDPEFSRDWELCFNIGISSLESEAVRRAKDGVPEPVWYKGEEVGSVQKYSDGLLQFLLKGNMREKYGDRIQADLRTITIPQEKLKALSDEELQALANITEKLVPPEGS